MLLDRLESGVHPKLAVECPAILFLPFTYYGTKTKPFRAFKPCSSLFRRYGGNGAAITLRKLGLEASGHEPRKSGARLVYPEYILPPYSPSSAFVSMHALALY